MSSELGVSSEPRQSTARVPPLNIGELPQDVLNQIFLRLSPPDLQAVALTSQGMNRSVKEAAHFHEFHSIKKFIRILMQKLPEQKEWFVEIAQNIVFQNFANLLLLKGYILDVKAQLIGVIKTVDEERAKGLHDVQPPHFLENIFTLAAFERQIDAAYLIPDENERGEALGDISKDLARAGAIDRSLEVATSIADEGERCVTFGAISEILAGAGNIDRSLEVADLITNDESMRGFALWDISKALARAGNRDGSLAVAWLIPNESMRELALGDISRALTGAGDIDGSLEVATSIADEGTRGLALRDISRA